MPRVTLETAVYEGCTVTVRRLRQLCENGAIPSAKRYGALWTIFTDGHGRIKVIPAPGGGPPCSIEQPARKTSPRAHRGPKGA